MGKLGKVLRWVDTFTKWQGYIVSALCLTLIGSTIFDITARQFGLYTDMIFDLEWFQYAALLMLPLGYAVLRGAHVRVDIVTERFSPRTQAIIMAGSYLVFVIPVVILIAKYGWDFAMMAYDRHETTTTAWHGMLWPVKSLIFVGAILMLPQCFVELIRNTIFAIKKVKL